MSELKRLRNQQKGHQARIKAIEKKYQGIADEFEDVLGTLTEWLSVACAYPQIGDYTPLAHSLTELMTKTENILRKLREKYG